MWWVCGRFGDCRRRTTSPAKDQPGSNHLQLPAWSRLGGVGAPVPPGPSPGGTGPSSVQHESPTGRGVALSTQPVPLNDKCADPPLRRWRREHRLCSEAPPRIDATDEIGPEASRERSVPKCIYLVGRRHPVRHPISSGVIGSVCLTPPSGG